MSSHLLLIGTFHPALLGGTPSHMTFSSKSVVNIFNLDMVHAMTLHEVHVSASYVILRTFYFIFEIS